MRFLFLSFSILAVVMSSATENASATSATRSAAFVTSTASSSTTTAAQHHAEQADETTQESASEIPMLPAADPDADIPGLQLGEVMRFEEMGPIIINLDGTTRRIDNWDEMTERERQVTWRRISKRNEERRKMLLEKTDQEQQNGSAPQQTEDL